MDNNFFHRITILGLPSSGKTWFRIAFARSILRFSRLLSEEYTVSLTDSQTKGPVLIFPDDLNPEDEFKWEFSWFKKKQAYVCSHAHELLLSEIRGAECKILGTGNESQHTIETIIRSDLIIFLITLPDSSHPALAQSEPEQLVKTIQQLYIRIANSSKPLSLAFCISKLDKTSIDKKDFNPENAISSYFGSNLLDLMHYGHGRPNTSLNFFGLSSAGYLQNTKDQANYDDQNNLLTNRSYWCPWNVEAPFFWYLGGKEKDRILSAGNKIAKLFYLQKRTTYYQQYSLYNAVQSYDNNISD